MQDHHGCGRDKPVPPVATTPSSSCVGIPNGGGAVALLRPLARLASFGEYVTAGGMRFIASACATCWQWPQQILRISWKCAHRYKARIRYAWAVATSATLPCRPTVAVNCDPPVPPRRRGVVAMASSVLQSTNYPLPTTHYHLPTTNYIANRMDVGTMKSTRLN